MKVFPEIILFDPAAPDASDPLLRGSDGPTLIYPSVAMDWISSGRLEGYALLPRQWQYCLPDDMERAYDLMTDGRRRLAEQVVIGAIASGRLRCVRVTEVDASRTYRSPLPQLSVVDPRQFLEGRLEHDWDDGFMLRVYDPEDVEDCVCIYDALFFWDEVQALMPPSHGRDAGDAEQPSPRLATITPPMPLDALDPGSNVRSVYHHPSLRKATPRSGRPAGKDGEPIAAFMLRIQSIGMDELNGIKDDALGQMLIEEYQRLELNEPHATNAIRNAKGVIRALRGRAEVTSLDDK